MESDIVNSAAGSDAESYPPFFSEPAGVQVLARIQGVSLVNDTDTLFADFWPASESVEELAATVRAWRDEAD